MKSIIMSLLSLSLVASCLNWDRDLSRDADIPNGDTDAGDGDGNVDAATDYASSDGADTTSDGVDAQPDARTNHASTAPPAFCDRSSDGSDGSGGGLQPFSNGRIAL